MEKKSIKDILNSFSKLPKNKKEVINEPNEESKKKFSDILKNFNKPFNSENRPRINDGDGTKLRNVLEGLKRKHNNN